MWKIYINGNEIPQDSRIYHILPWEVRKGDETVFENKLICKYLDDKIKEKDKIEILPMDFYIIDNHSFSETAFIYDINDKPFSLIKGKGDRLSYVRNK